jgi:hypothetical protein
VRDDLVIRLKRRLTDDAVAALNEEFAGLVKTGRSGSEDAYKRRERPPRTPPIAFTHTRRQFAWSAG